MEIAIKEIQKQDWYSGLVEDCKGIVVEAGFISRWTVIEGYHALGKRISEEHDNFERESLWKKDCAMHCGKY